MNKIRVAIIAKNACTFDKMEELAMPLLYTPHTTSESKRLKQIINDYIWSVIGPYVTFVELELNDLITVTCGTLSESFVGKTPGDFMYHTEGSYSFPKKYIEFMYCQPLWKDYQKSRPENINNIGCFLSLKHNVIENNCVVISNKYNLSSSSFTTIDSITKDDIIRIIRRRFFFTAILIKENSFVKYYYQNPRYLIMKIYNLSPNDNIAKSSCTLFRHNLVFYFKNNKNEYLNQIATRINGAFQLYGDTLMLHELDTDIFGNLSVHEAKRLNVLAYGRLYDRDLKPHEIQAMDDTVEVKGDSSEETEKKIIPIWSRYIIIERRMLSWKQHKDECINCQKITEKLFPCDRCFRVKYCSDQCKKEFGSYHSGECF